MTRAATVAVLATLASVLQGAPSAQDYGLPGPHLAGEGTVTVSRPDGSTFSARLYYPALAAGAGAPFDATAAPYPGVSFGHGFLQPVDSYASTLRHLATWGHFAIATTTQGGFLPNHSAFADDMRHCLTWLELRNVDPTSPFVGAVDVAAFGLAGHSMGGGASLLAAAADPRVRAVVPMAPANTNPSSIAAAANVGAPLRIVVGSQDTIVPTNSNGALMFAAAPGPRQRVDIQGGWHCGFVDTVVFGGLGCDSGVMPRAAQLVHVRRALAEFFEAHLARDAAAVFGAWGAPTDADPELAVQRDARFTLTPRAARAAAVAGQVAAIRFEVRNDGVAPTSFTFATSSSWPAVFAPATTPMLAAGQSTFVDLLATVPAPPVAPFERSRVTVTRDLDGATAVYTSVSLARR